LDELNPVKQTMMEFCRFRDFAVPLLGLSTGHPSIHEIRATRLVDSSFRAPHLPDAAGTGLCLRARTILRFYPGQVSELLLPHWKEGKISPPHKIGMNSVPLNHDIYPFQWNSSRTRGVFRKRLYARANGRKKAGLKRKKEPSDRSTIAWLRTETRHSKVENGNAS
jgi:hypothetical protein